MKKYRVVMSYVMAIPFEISANNEEEAEEEAQRKIDEMSNEEFVVAGEPQHEETQVEEIE